jgi:hypothetical protein
VRVYDAQFDAAFNPLLTFPSSPADGEPVSASFLIALTAGEIEVTGGSDSRPPTASKYASLLGLRTGEVRKSTKTRNARPFGDSTS